MNRLLILFLALFLFSCGNEATSPGQKLDTLLKKIDTSVERLGDSTKVEFRKLRDKVDDIHIDIRRDSTKKDTSRR
jgi:hypothetical protein